jgi:flagellar protein FlbB
VRRSWLPLCLIAAALLLFAPDGPSRHAGAAEGGARRAPARLTADDAASLEQKRQQLAEKEAALNAKEEALRKLSASVDAKVNELNAAKKGLENSLVAKKKQDDERYKKMIKIYKGLKAEQAATLLNKLDDKLVIEMLNQMDQKTAVKLIPLITQPRVLEWTRLNLNGK